VVVDQIQLRVRGEKGEHFERRGEKKKEKLVILMTMVMEIQASSSSRVA